MTPATLPLVFAHGWGFHAGVWGRIVEHLDRFEVSYFGTPYIRGGPTLRTEIPINSVVVGYSFGFAQAVVQVPTSTRAIISICGFDSLPARGRGAAIDDIRAGLKRNPSAQMRAFWANCGISRFANANDLDADALERGLDAMLEVDAAPTLQALSCPVLALASRNDQIVPLEVSRAVWGPDTLIESETGGHGLPVTRPLWCAEQIKNFLEAHVS